MISISQLKRSLYPHQLVSIKNMKKLEEDKTIQVYDNRTIYTTIGFLSDLTGYGKTQSILGLIAVKSNWDCDKTPFPRIERSGNDFVYRLDHELLEKINCSIVILNSILLNQWEKELGFTTLSWKKVKTKKDAETIDLGSTELVLCDYQYFPIISSRFSKNAFKRIIIDEPNTIKLGENIKFNSDFIWFITATPYDVFENNKYKNIIPTDSTIFEKIIIKNDDNFVKESFIMPPNTINKYKCTNIVYDILKGNIKSNIEYLATSENVPLLLECLGAKKEDYESVVVLVYNRKYEKLDEINKLLEIKKDSKKLWERKESLENEIKNLNESFQVSLEENSCPICLENYKDPVIVSCCQNIFCGSCITNHIIQAKTNPKKCPICRNHISMKNVICIEMKLSITPSKNKTLFRTKSQTILDIINTTKDGKFIIYSEFMESFDTIKRLLEENNIVYSELKGLKSNKEKSLENYRNGSVRVLFLTTIQYSAGIDLMNTTDIILYHDMSESIKTQIIGRANRIGRNIPLIIHCL